MEKERAYIAKHTNTKDLFLVIQEGAGYMMYPISRWETPPEVLDGCKGITDEFDLKKGK